MLTDANKRFIEEYVANGYKDAWVCYGKAYPNASEVTCRVNAGKILAKPEAQAYMRGLQHERFLQLNINADRIAEELSKMAFDSIDQESLMKYSDKLKALDLLQKQLGLQVQKQEVKQEPVEIKVGFKDGETPPNND